jgi:hypothetical protein
MSSKRPPHAPLASAEDIDQHGYAIPRDNLPAQQQSGSSGGSRGSAGKAAPGKVDSSQRLKSGSEYAQPVDPQLQQAAARKSKHRERRQQMALQQQGGFSGNAEFLSTSLTQDGRPRLRFLRQRHTWQLRS